MKPIMKLLALLLVALTVLGIMGSSEPHQIDLSVMERHYKENHRLQGQVNEQVEAYRAKNKGKYPPIR